MVKTSTNGWTGVHQNSPKWADLKSHYHADKCGWNDRLLVINLAFSVESIFPNLQRCIDRVNSLLYDKSQTNPSFGNITPNFVRENADSKPMNVRKISSINKPTKQVVVIRLLQYHRSHCETPHLATNVPSVETENWIVYSSSSLQDKTFNCVTLPPFITVIMVKIFLHNQRITSFL